jgi:hypothetical protein
VLSLPATADSAVTRRTTSRIPQTVAVRTLTIGAQLAAVPVVSGRFWGPASDSAPVVPHLIRVYGLSLMGLGMATLRPARTRSR